MPQSIPMGPSVPMVQNQVYALPANVCFVTSTLAVDVSVDGTTWTALPDALTGKATGAVFVRCTLAGCTIVAKDASNVTLMAGGGGVGLAATLMEFSEVPSPPGIPANNNARMWIQDTAGKSTLMFRFPLGPVITLASEP